MFKVLVFIFLCSTTLFAKEWVVNSDHSYIEFEVSYLLISKVKGRFRKFSGRLIEGPDKRFELRINSSSVDTGSRVRDGHLREKDFFHSKLFPQITFISSTISNKSLTGKLKFRGKEKLVTFKTEMTARKLDTWKYENKFLKFSAVLSLKNLGIDWNKTLPGEELVLGDEIRVEGIMQLQPSDSLTPGYKYKIPDTGYIRMREKVQRGEIEAPVQEDLESKFKMVPIVKRPALTPVMKKMATSFHGKEQSEGLPVYLSLLFISLMTFAGLIISSIYIKDMAAEKYGHIKRIGFVTDFICIGLALLFAVCLGIIWKIL